MQNISAAELAQYRATAQRRQAAYQQQQIQRQQLGWQVARQAAELLQQHFQVRRVWLFGSMLEAQRIRSESDIDLAVEGLADDQYLQAVAELLDLSAFSVDLVQMEHASPRLREVIEQKGVEL
ncbi:MAG: nucleotidyltransferase domain-containing protein [Cyanobacteria bacterium P01_H01_bin.119]